MDITNGYICHVLIFKFSVWWRKTKVLVFADLSAERRGRHLVSQFCFLYNIVKRIKKYNIFINVQKSMIWGVRGFRTCLQKNTKIVCVHFFSDFPEWRQWKGRQIIIFNYLSETVWPMSVGRCLARSPTSGTGLWNLEPFFIDQIWK